MQIVFATNSIDLNLVFWSRYSWTEKGSGTLGNRERSLTRSTRKSDRSDNNLVFLCPIAPGYCRRLLIHSLGSTASRHYHRYSKADLVVLLLAFPSTLLATRLSWAPSSVPHQPALTQLSPARKQMAPGTRVSPSISHWVSLR